VPFEQGFRFATQGVYTGITATSLSDLLAKLEGIDPDALFFHYQRGDFQRWIRNTLGDDDLADRIELVNRTIFNQQTISLDELRNDLKRIIQKRIAELK
jgi:hypothetical protein